MDWLSWISLAIMNVVVVKELDATYSRRDSGLFGLHLPSESANKNAQLPAVLQGLASTAQAATDLHLSTAATEHAGRRTKRDHPLYKALFRDDKGVDVLSSLSLVAGVPGLVSAVLSVPSALLLASLQGDTVTVSELRLDTSQMAVIGRFSGGDVCGFSEAGGRVLLVCGPPLVGDVAKVMVREVVRSGSRRGVRPLHPVFLNNVVATAAWQQDGADYLLLADNSRPSDASTLVRNSRRFPALKVASEQTCDGSIQLYRWTEHNYDPVDSLPAERPEKVLHFVINNFNFIVVAESEPESISVVYRFSLDRSRYVLLQRLPLGGAATGAAVFTLGSTIEKNTFIALTTSCSGIVCKGSPMVVIYKYFGGRFEPFQALEGPPASEIVALQHSGGAVLCVTLVNGNLLFFQYSGWRFVEVWPRGLPSLDNYHSATVAAAGENISIIALTSGTETGQPETNFYKLNFESKSPLRDYHSSINEWLKRSLQVSGVASGVMRQVKGVPHTDGPPVAFTGSITVRGDVTVLRGNVSAAQVYESSRGLELPSTLADSFARQAELNQRLRVLDLKRQGLVSLSSQEGWPRRLVAASASVLGPSSVSTAHVNGTINGQLVPGPGSLVPLSSSLTVKLRDVIFAEVFAKGGVSTSTLNGQPWSRLVTLQGAHTFKSNVTMSRGAAVARLTTRGRVCGHRFEDYLLSSSPQTITGDLACKSAVMKKLTSDNINSIRVRQLLDTAVKFTDDFTLKGALYVGGNVTYGGSLGAAGLHGTSLEGFMSSVMLKRSVTPQYITGKHTYNEFAVFYLSVKGTLNNVCTSDLFVNQRGKVFTVPKCNFNSLTVDSLKIEREINGIKSVGGKLDIMQLKADQTVSGSKEFASMHFSDVYQPEEQASSLVTTTTTQPSTTTATVDQVALNRSLVITAIQHKLEHIAIMEKFLTNLTFPTMKDSSSASPIFIGLCKQVGEMFDDADSLLKDLTVLQSLNSTVEKCLKNKSFVGSGSTVGKKILAGFEVLNRKRVNLLAETRSRLKSTRAELETLKRLSQTTVAPSEMHLLVSNPEIERLNNLEHSLHSELYELENSLKILNESRLLLERRNLSVHDLVQPRTEQSAQTLRFRGAIVAIQEFHKSRSLSGTVVDTAAILADISLRITDISAEIWALEHDLAEVRRALRRLQQAQSLGLAGFVGQMGPGSWVRGTVAGQDLAALGALLQSIGPAASRRREFIVTNASTISNIEFRAGLSVRSINGVDMSSIANRLIPLSNLNLPMRLEFQKETKVLGDVSASVINGLSVTNLLTLNGSHTVPHHVTMQDSLHSSGDVVTSTFDGVRFSAETSFLAKTDNRQVFPHRVTFRDVEARNVSGGNVSLSGVALEDVMTVFDNVTVTGSYNFSALQVLDSVAKVEKLQTETVNSVNMERLLSNTLRKTPRASLQVVTGTKTFPSLSASGDVRTEGVSSQRPDLFAAGTDHNLTRLVANVIRLDHGGNLSHLLTVRGAVGIEHLNITGFLDGVQFPVKWLRSSGDQSFTAGTVFFSSLNAENVRTSSSDLSGILGRLSSHAIKTDLPSTFTQPISFASLQVLRPLTVSGSVQGLALPHDLVPSSVASVTLTGHKLLLATVFATPLVRATLNGVDVNKLCLMNSVVNVTVYGDAVFEKNLNVGEIRDGDVTIPLDNPGAFWRLNDSFTTHGEIIFVSADAPAGVTADLLNGLPPKAAFRSRVARQCSSLDADAIWSFQNLIVGSATVKEIHCNLFQEKLTHDLSSVLSTHGDQTITGIYEIHSAAVDKLTVLGRINSLTPTSFCRRTSPCYVTAPHSFAGGLGVLGNMELLPNSTVRGVAVGAAARQLARRGQAVVVRGRTTVVGSLAATVAVRSDCLINGVNFTGETLLTKSDNRSISRSVILSCNSSAPTISAPRLVADDGLLSNFSLAGLVQQSVVRGVGLSVVRGLTAFSGPVTFLDADSAYAIPKIEPPEEIVHLKEDYFRLQTTLQLEDKAVPALLGWEEVQRIPGDWYSVVNVEAAVPTAAPLLALLSWRGPATLLQQHPKTDLYQDTGARLYGTCVADVSGWRSSKHLLKLVVSDACPLAQADGFSPATGTEKGFAFVPFAVALKFGELAMIVSNVTQKSQVGTTVFLANGKPCLASVSAATSGIPVFCETDERIVLVQTLPCERPLKVSAAVLGSEVLLVVASLGRDPYGGILEFWLNDNLQNKFEMMHRLSEPGVSWVSAATTERGVLVATVSRNFRDRTAVVTIYSVSNDRTVSVLERLSVQGARQATLLLSPPSSVGLRSLLVLTDDGRLLRYSASRDGRFVFSGRLQQGRVLGLTAWVLPSSGDDPTETRLAVVLEATQANERQGSFVIFKQIFSDTSRFTTEKKYQTLRLFNF